MSSTSLDPNPWHVANLHEDIRNERMGLGQGPSLPIPSALLLHAVARGWGGAAGSVRVAVPPAGQADLLFEHVLSQTTPGKVPCVRAARGHC